MINSFRTANTENLWNRKRVREYQPFERQAQRRLNILDAATSLEDLRLIRSNKLHKLKGDRDGQWAIWINDKWRICFLWGDDGATEVEITDYHD